MKRNEKKRPDSEHRQPPGVSLPPDESLVVVVRPSRFLSIPKYIVTLGLYGLWRKRHVYVVTDKRLLIGRGILVRTERSVPFSRIEDVQFVRKMAGAYCNVAATSHGRRSVSALGPLAAKKARLVARELQVRT